MYDKEIDRVEETLINLKATIEADEARDQSKFQDQQLSFTNQIKVYTDAGDRNAAKIQDKLDRLPNPANKAPWKERRKNYEGDVAKLEAEKYELLDSRESIFANLTVAPEVTQEIERLQLQREKTLSSISDQIQTFTLKKLSLLKANLISLISNHKICAKQKC